MAESFDNFNAPQFFDFIANVPEIDDKVFFEQITETESIDPLRLDPVSKSAGKEWRRSMSVSDMQYLQEALDQAQIRSVVPEKEHKLLKSTDHINKLSQPKRYALSEDHLNRNHYVPLAEAIRTFHNTTPDRFHSKKTANCTKAHPVKLAATIPQTPHLATTSRSRPMHILSREEEEWLKFQQEQKFKFKARPLDKKILKGPFKPTVPIKKPTTEPAPFKLTVVSNKVVAEPIKIKQEFHANPIPRAVYEGPKFKEKQTIITECITPTFMKKYKDNSRLPSVEKDKPKSANKPRRTKPLPFSFEVRDKYIQKRKEELIKKTLENEKKAREFHAQPIPKGILEPSKMTKSLSLKSVELHSNKSKSDENMSAEFKARPASVLHKKPFIPIKEEKPVTEIVEFALNTEIRVAEREEFERYKKEKEEMLMKNKQEVEERRRKAEEEETIRLRKLTEYKAQPVRKYKEVIIQPSHKITMPISPKFQLDMIKRKKELQKNKENIKDCDNF